MEDFVVGLVVGTVQDFDFGFVVGSVFGVVVEIY